MFDLPENFDLNNARNGLYYTKASYVVYTLVNRPEGWTSGEISVLSVHNGYGSFQFAIQTTGGDRSFKKRTYADYGGWSTWTSV